MNTTKILVTFANQYEIADEKTGLVTRGCTLNYFFFGDTGEMFKSLACSDGPIGYQRAKCSLDYDMRKKIKKAPAIYDAEFEMSIGSDGKPVMKVVDLKFVSDFYIELPEIIEK